jgi:hypothetical protein
MIMRPLSDEVQLQIGCDRGNPKTRVQTTNLGHLSTYGSETVAIDGCGVGAQGRFWASGLLHRKAQGVQKIMVAGT